MFVVAQTEHAEIEPGSFLGSSRRENVNLALKASLGRLW